MSVEIGDEVRGIEIRSDFPDRRNSPDPEAVIGALLDYGTWVQAADEVGCGERTLRYWRDKYPEIKEAYREGSAALGYESEQWIVDIMRNDLDEDDPPAKASDRLAAAKRIAAVNHPDKDYTQRERRQIEKSAQETMDETKKKIENMSTDEKLDAFNKIMEESE